MDKANVIGSLLLLLGTGLQVLRWMLLTAREQNRLAEAAETRGERRRWALAGPPLFETVTWAMLFVGAVMLLVASLNA